MIKMLKNNLATILSTTTLSQLLLSTATLSIATHSTATHFKATLTTATLSSQHLPSPQPHHFLFPLLDYTCSPNAGIMQHPQAHFYTKHCTTLWLSLYPKFSGGTMKALLLTLLLCSVLLALSEAARVSIISVITKTSARSLN